LAQVNKKTKELNKRNSFFFCLGNGRLLTAFTNRTFQTKIFEELTLPINMRYSIKSIIYQKMSVELFN
jgi:hypothetical protein